MMFEINGYELKQTCGACPEQYNVFKDGKQVGYLRLRHRIFNAHVPDAEGELVYEAYPKGDGVFTPEERIGYLTDAINKIHRCIEIAKKLKEKKMRKLSEKEEREEFEKKQAAIFVPIPKEFHSYFSYLAWEEGHSCGYDEVLNCLIIFLDGFVPALNEYRDRIVQEFLKKFLKG